MMFNNPFSRNLVTLFTIPFVISILVFFTFNKFTPAQQMENWTADLRTALFPREIPANNDIVLVTINEETLSSLPYRSPVDRGFVSDVLKTLERKKVKAIGIDMLFDGGSEASKDSRLRETLQQLSIPVIVGKADAELTSKQKRFLATFLNGIATGLVNLAKDPNDGVVRWVYPGKQLSDGFQFSLVNEMAVALGYKPAMEFKRLTYFGDLTKGEAPFPSFPAHTIQHVPDGWLEGKVVLLGADLPFEDRHKTPYSALTGPKEGALPGLTIHAFALAQIIEGGSLNTIDAVSAFLILLAAGVIATGLSFIDLGVIAKTSATITLVGIYWIVASVAFVNSSVILPFVSPAMCIVVGVSVSSISLHGRERRLRRYIKNAFARYLDPKIVKILLQDPSRLKLGGERRTLSIMFTDIEDFTSLCEKHPPDRILEMLNKYLDGMCNIVMSHGGTIDKIIGDALFCFFNAPLPQADHRERAMACASELDAFGRRFRKRYSEKGIDFGRTRIGVHCSEAIVGNAGGDTRFHYTAYGDAVNFTARLEAANKVFGTSVLVSRSCFSDVESSVHRLRPVGDLIVAGKSEAVSVFELYSNTQNEYAPYEEYVEAFTLMKNIGQKSVRAFEKLLEASPDDDLVRFHANRLANGEQGTALVLKTK